MLTNLHTRHFLASLGMGFALFGASQAQAQTITWTGAVDTIYTRPANWNLQRVPNRTDDVLIPNTANKPSLSPALGIGTAGNLTIAVGARLRLNGSGELDLFGNLVNNGTFGGDGTLSIRTLPTATAPVVHTLSGAGSAIAIRDMELMANAPTTLQIPVRLTRQLTLTSNLTTATASNLTLISTPPTPQSTNPGATAFISNQGGVVVGSATIQRAIDPSVNAGLGYRHYSSPVINSTVGDLATTTGFTPEISQGAFYNESSTPPTTTPFPTVFGYNQALVNRTNSSPNFDKGWFVPLSFNSPLLVGQGYTVNIGGNQLVDFVGTPTTGNIAVTVSRNAAGTLNSGDAGWIFLGNPYPSPIDWSRATTPATTGTQSSTALADIADGMYVYSSTGQYAGFYRAYANGVGNPVIPLGQAFFVRKASAGAATFTFTDALRLTTSDATTFQRKAPDQRPQLEMALRSSDRMVQDMLNVYFQPGSTDGVDTRYDAVKPLNNNGMFLGTLTADGQELAIDGRPVPTDQLTIPLHVAVAASGTYTLEMAKLANMGDLHAYLHDLKLGALVDLAKEPSYAVTLSATNAGARFELIFSARPVEVVAPAALTSQVALYPSPAKDVAYIELPASLGSEVVAATLVDALGRTVRTASLPARRDLAHQLDVTGLRAGIYALRLHTSAGVVAKRLVIE